MFFSYATYWNNMLVLPIIIIIAMLVLLFAASYDYWLKSTPKHTKHTNSATTGYIFCLIIIIICMIPQYKALMNGAIYLLDEKEEDACIHIGVIESICEPSERFPGFKSYHCYGADIVIDGDQYFAITSGDFKEGESVTVCYLPNSHFVLSLFRSNAN